MRKKERYEKILAWFRENRPIAETELHSTTSPFCATAKAPEIRH